MTCSPCFGKPISPTRCRLPADNLYESGGDVTAIIDHQLRPLPSGNASAWLVQPPIFSRVSPFHAKTGTPAFAIAAAAWSWVEKILQLATDAGAERNQCFDQDRSLDRHMKRTGHAHALKRLAWGIFHGSPSGLAFPSRQWKFPYDPNRPGLYRESYSR